MEVGFDGINSDLGLGLSNLGFEPKFGYWSGDLGQVLSEPPMSFSANWQLVCGFVVRTEMSLIQKLE